MKVNDSPLAAGSSGSRDVLGSSQQSSGSGQKEGGKERGRDAVTVTMCHHKLASALSAKAVGYFLLTKLFYLPPS